MGFGRLEQLAGDVVVEGEREALGEVSEDGRGVGPGEVGATGEDGVDIDVAGEVAELAACGGGERAGRLVDEEDEAVVAGWRRPARGSRARSNNNII